MSTADPLRGIARGVERISGYSGLDPVRVTVYRPTEPAQVAALLGYAQAVGRRVTLRGGGHCFDAQAVGEDLVVSMAGLDEIRVEPERELVHVGPGATWGAILRALQRHGLVPAVTVTTSHATAGGTLAADCLSRFSPARGKEGEWIEELVLVTAAGDTVLCTRPPHGDAAEWTDPQRLFMGVVAGLGYLGAVVAITYKVLAVGRARHGIAVRTFVQKLDGHRRLAEQLGPSAQLMRAQRSDVFEESKHDAIYAALAPGGVRRRQALLFRSSYTRTRDRPGLLLFRPYNPVQVPVHLLVRWKAFNRVLWRVGYRLGFGHPDGYVNELADFTFFLDANVRARRWARPLRLKTVQQTFVVPSDDDRLPDWLDHAQGVLDQRGLKPTLVDVLWLPEGLPFHLSPTSDMAGYAVSYAFETSRRREIARIREAFAALADTLLDDYGGRVYLAKNVSVSATTLAAMYGDHAERFLALKAEIDPTGVLRNGFFDDVLGAFSTLAGTSAPPAPGDGPQPSAAG
jgi:FAD/FMN-containing dehydrogenase